ncbi:MAG: PIN domain-containing protein [Bifidobacteriaceae bacterium]|jgi:predicted nucleic acid-binding protein|nr:PIN domain-containing protein [Bifidobacteriaceae bacterium]
MPRRRPVQRVVLDTDVAVDYLDSARPAHRDAVDLLTALVASDDELCLVATSLKDVYYLLTRAANESSARRAVAALSEVMTILPVDADTCAAALASGEPDFEDGLIRAGAEAAGADWIVTRDAAAFAGSTVPKADAAALLARFRLG